MGGEGETEPGSGGGASEPGQLSVPRESRQWGAWGRAGDHLIGGRREDRCVRSGGCCLGEAALESWGL